MRSVRDLFDLSGRVALITGGAGHLGGAMAEALAEWGASLALLDTDADRIDAAIDAALAAGARHVFPLGIDLADAGALRIVPQLVMRELGRLDILINCAALLDAPGLDVPFEQQSLETWRRSMEVNLTAAFALTQACLPMLRATGHGSIINVASIYGLVGPDLRLYDETGMGCGAAYAASKAGLIGLTRHLATVLAPEVRVNAIVPGGVVRAGQEAGFVRRYCERVPLGRMATEEDVQGVAVWLASDASAYVTGAVIPIDGGWLAW